METVKQKVMRAWNTDSEIEITMQSGNWFFGMVSDAFSEIGGKSAVLLATYDSDDNVTDHRRFPYKDIANIRFVDETDTDTQVDAEREEAAWQEYKKNMEWLININKDFRKSLCGMSEYIQKWREDKFGPDSPIENDIEDPDEVEQEEQFLEQLETAMDRQVLTSIVYGEPPKVYTGVVTSVDYLRGRPSCVRFAHSGFVPFAAIKSVHPLADSSLSESGTMTRKETEPDPLEGDIAKQRWEW